MHHHVSPPTLGKHCQAKQSSYIDECYVHDGIEVVSLNSKQHAMTIMTGTNLLLGQPKSFLKVSLNSRSMKAGHVPMDEIHVLQLVTTPLVMIHESVKIDVHDVGVLDPEVNVAEQRPNEGSKENETNTHAAASIAAIFFCCCLRNKMDFQVRRMSKNTSDAAPPQQTIATAQGMEWVRGQGSGLRASTVIFVTARTKLSQDYYRIRFGFWLWQKVCVVWSYQVAYVISCHMHTSMYRSSPWLVLLPGTVPVQNLYSFILFTRSSEYRYSSTPVQALVAGCTSRCCFRYYTVLEYTVFGSRESVHKS